MKKVPRPPLIHMRPFLINSQIRRQPYPPLPILIPTTAMNHPRTVKHHIPRLIVRHQPPLPLPLLLRPLLSIMTEMPQFAHVPVERAYSLFERHVLLLLSVMEICLHALAKRAAVLEVHEPPAIGGAVTNGHPGGDEDGVASAQEELVVVNPARTLAAGDVVPYQASVHYDFLFPARQVPHHRAKSGVREKLVVLVVCMHCVEQSLCTLLWRRAEALMLVRVEGGIKDSISGTHAFLEEAGGGEVGEVNLAEVVDVVAGYDVFDPDVTVLCVAALHFGERGVAGRWPEPGDYGSVDV